MGFHRGAGNKGIQNIEYWVITVKLIIGNKNYSSWSLRPWLLPSVHGIPFEEVGIDEAG